MTNTINEIIGPIYYGIATYIKKHPYLANSIGYGVLLLVPIFSFYMLSTENYPLSNMKQLIYILSLGLSAYIWLYIFVGKTFTDTKYSLHITGILALLFLAGLIYLSIELSASSMSSVNIIMNLIIALGIIVGLAILFLMFYRYLRNLDGMAGFIISLIFYIPCLFIDLFRYLTNEVATTHKMIYYLFVAEIVLILLYFYLPDLLKKVVISNGKQLLEGAAFLDIEKVVASSDQLQATPISISNNDVPTAAKNYALSMWIYLDGQPKNFNSYNKETVIFNYGDGKPKITYVNNLDDPAQKDKVNVYFTNSPNSLKTHYGLSITKQKWNNFVFNYSSQRVDLFVNGTLEKTFEFSNNMPVYIPSDKIVVGATDGLDGAICNIKYYPTNLTKFEIANTYNILMNKNPPVNI